jgi:uncharacterized heparinase superfamily protein
MKIRSLSELAGRARQEMAKRLERAGRRRPPRWPSRPADLAPDAFFAGALEPATPGLLAERMPDARAAVLAAADRIARGRFDLLGFRDLFFGDPVDWHLDPIAGRRAPHVHWSRVDVLDPGLVGDCKVIWELNRHQWLVQLGQAYRLTGDERYARTFAGHVASWLESNPPGMGINWTSSLEVAFRLIAWCWSLVLFRGARALPADLRRRMLGAVELHARHVARYPSTYSSPNTHLTAEALGLFYAGVLFPALPAAPAWRRRAARILIAESERQVLPDGVYFEQSTCYQRYTIEIYLHFLVLAARAGVSVPPAVRERVQRLLDFLLAVRRPDGSLPPIGDDDGGQLLALAPREAGDVRGVFAAAAAVFGRADYAWAAGGPAPEPLWLLGAAGLDTVAGLRATLPTGGRSRLFAHGGYAVMRSGWEADAHHLIFDVGPLGCPISGGHGHADLLSVQVAAFGRAALTDGGTYRYAASPAWRDFFRSAAAHSTLTVDGEPLAVGTSAFQWRERPRAQVRAWLSTREVDFADADHDAYRRLPDPVTHRRRVLFVKPRYWVIADDVSGALDHRIELRFQLAPVTAVVDPTRWIRATGADGRGLLIRAFAGVPLTASVHEGALGPIRGWVSPIYGRREPAPVVVYEAATRLPMRILTLLVPVADPLAPAPAVELVTDSAGMPRGLVLDDGREHIRVDDRVIVTIAGPATGAALSTARAAARSVEPGPVDGHGQER